MGKSPPRRKRGLEETLLRVLLSSVVERWPAGVQSIFTRRRNCWFSLQMNSIISSSGEIC